MNIRFKLIALLLSIFCTKAFGFLAINLPFVGFLVDFSVKEERAEAAKTIHQLLIDGHADLVTTVPNDYTMLSLQGRFESGHELSSDPEAAYVLVFHAQNSLKKTAACLKDFSESPVTTSQKEESTCWSRTLIMMEQLQDLLQKRGAIIDENVRRFSQPTILFTVSNLRQALLAAVMGVTEQWDTYFNARGIVCRPKKYRHFLGRCD
jgi:hypothetical protein